MVSTAIARVVERAKVSKKQKSCRRLRGSERQLTVAGLLHTVANAGELVREVGTARVGGVEAASKSEIVVSNDFGLV